MGSKNSVQVLIGGKIYTLSGYESEEYLQRVAAYLNTKISEIRAIPGYNGLSADMRALFLNLNTADDYFKLKKQADELSTQSANTERQLFEVKHDLIQAQIQLETAQKDLEALRSEEKEQKNRISFLENQVANLKKNQKGSN